MDAIELRAALETREKKDGSGTYQVVAVYLTDTYKKSVFLEESEKELIRLSTKDKSNEKKNKMPF